MHVEDKETGRWSFVYHMNNPEPFLRFRETRDGFTSYYYIDWTSLALAEMVPEAFKPIDDWLSVRTSAYRINTATVTHTYNGLEKWRNSVIIIEVPGNLAVLFKMFWY